MATLLCSFSFGDCNGLKSILSFEIVMSVYIYKYTFDSSICLRLKLNMFIQLCVLTVGLQSPE
jgi:hypothetical protein